MNRLRALLGAGWERLVAVTSPDENEARLGRLFNILMLISLLVVTGITASVWVLAYVGLIEQRVALFAEPFPIAFAPVAVMCLVLSRFVRVRPVVHGYVWVNFLAIAAAVWLFDGTLSPIWVLFIWNISVAGILLAPTYALWMSMGVLAYYGLMMGLTRWNLYAPLFRFEAEGRAYLHVFLSLLMLASTVGLLTYLNMRSLHRALERIRESEARFHNVFDNARDIIFTVSREAVFTSLNPAFEQVTGWPVKEWLGKPFAPILAEAGLPKAFEVLEKTLREETVDVFELPARKQSGEEFIGEFTVAPLWQGGDLVVLGICRDITERKRMEAEIVHLNERLEAKVQERTKQLLEAQEELVRKEKLSTLGQVAGVVGHELRNPLGVMNNALYFLKTVLTDVDDTVKDYLNMIGDEIEAADLIVSDLLDSVRTKPPNLQPVAPAALVADSLKKCPVPDNVSLQVAVDEGLPLVIIDPRQMQQVFINLISNAVQAMPEGGALSISAEAGEECVQLRVSDTGTGIAPENMANLFKPLFTTKSKGLGLGLTVVKNLTENSGGRVGVESEPGKGAIFTVSLPRLAQTSDQQEKPNAS